MILSGLYVIIFLGKDWPQSEGSRHADLGIKSPPARARAYLDYTVYEHTKHVSRNVIPWKVLYLRPEDRRPLLHDSRSGANPEQQGASVHGQGTAMFLRPTSECTKVHATYQKPPTLRNHWFATLRAQRPMSSPSTVPPPAACLSSKPLPVGLVGPIMLVYVRGHSCTGTSHSPSQCCPLTHGSRQGKQQPAP